MIHYFTGRVATLGGTVYSKLHQSHLIHASLVQYPVNNSFFSNGQSN